MEGRVVYADAVFFYVWMKKGMKTGVGCTLDGGERSHCILGWGFGELSAVDDLRAVIY